MKFILQHQIHQLKNLPRRDRRQLIRKTIKEIPRYDEVCGIIVGAVGIAGASTSFLGDLAHILFNTEAFWAKMIVLIPIVKGVFFLLNGFYTYPQIQKLLDKQKTEPVE